MIPATTPPTPANPAPPAQRWPMPPFVRASVGLHALAAGALALWPNAWPWAVGAVALDHLALTAAGLWPRSDWLGPNITRLSAAAAQRGEIAITLDDGPDPEVTPAVLDLLARHGTQATFFCIANKALAHAALTRRIVAAGHSVQNHSRQHSHNFSLLGPRGFAREIGQAQDMLADVTGVRPHCFRAPAGLRNPLLDPVLHRLGLHLVSWTRRGYDTRSTNASVVLARLSRGLAGGSILLLHDGQRQRTANGQAVLLEVLPSLLQRVQSLGLRTVTLTQALAPRSP